MEKIQNAIEAIKMEGIAETIKDLNHLLASHVEDVLTESEPNNEEIAQTLRRVQSTINLLAVINEEKTEIRSNSNG